VGRFDGREVGCDEVGWEVGRLVSPGCVGLEVVGYFEGRDVGAEEVGMEVGACTSTTRPIVTKGSRMTLIE
jgi:hypothetical protein